MTRLARKQGMAIDAVAGEAHAWLKLPPADAASFFDDVSSEALARFDLALKAQLGYAPITSTTLFRDPSRGADSTGFGLGMIHSF